MEEKEIIKKLEEISLPKIEISSHKKRLKEILLSRYYQEKRNWEIFNILYIFKKVILTGSVIGVLLFLILTNLILPQYSLAAAKKIALKDQQVQELTKDGAIIKDEKILADKVYLLIQPKEEIRIEPKEIITEEIIKERPFNLLVEVNLKEKRVAKIENLIPSPFPLVEKDREKVKEIIKRNPKIQKIIPKEAEIRKITPIPQSQLKLIQEKNSIKVVPKKEEKRVEIIYEFKKNRWKGEIDLIKEEVKKIEPLVEIKE